MGHKISIPGGSSSWNRTTGISLQKSVYHGPRYSTHKSSPPTKNLQNGDGWMLDANYVGSIWFVRSY